MLFTKLSALTILLAKRNLIPKCNLIIKRCKSFHPAENNRTRIDWNFRRKILNNTDGCILYDPSKYYHPNQDFIQNDEIILNFLRLNQSSGLNQSNESETKNLTKLLRVFDGKCLQHSTKWNIEQTLFVLDIWDRITPFKSHFSIVTPKRCLKFLNEIPHGLQLQLLHYMAYSKQHIDEAEQLDIMQRLDQNLDNLSLEEASFYYSALVRCECKTDNEKNTEHIRRWVHHLKRRELRNENPIALSSAIKAIGKLSSEKNIEDVKALQPRLIPLVKRSDVYQLTHFAQLGLRLRVFNPKLMELIVEKSLHFIRTASNTMRIKDVERVLLAISTFRVLTKDGIKDQFCEEVQPLLKNTLDTNFPLDLIQCIASLAIIGTVDHVLIDWALNYAANRNIPDAFAHHVLLIDSFAKVNLKGAYNGHVLSDEMCSELEAKCQNEIIDGFHFNLQTEIMDILKMENHHASVLKTIPYCKPHIIFIYNTRTRSTVEILQPAKEHGSIIYANELYNKEEPYLVPVAIVTYGKMSTLHSISSRAVNGRLQIQLTQLKLLGFHTVPWNVNITQWSEVDLAVKRQLFRNRLWIEQIQLFVEKNGAKANV